MQLLLQREQEKPAFPTGNPGKNGRCEVELNIEIKILMCLTSCKSKPQHLAEVMNYCHGGTGDTGLSDVR